MPNVAILMPYYNYLAGLTRTLESLRAEPEPFTLYLVDDGSVPPLALQTTHYPFPIHIIALDKNSGIEAALNAGLAKILLTDHLFIARMDAGDLWVPGRLAAQRDFLLAHPDYAVVGSWAVAFDASGANKFLLRYPSGDTTIRNYLYLNSAFCHPAVMLRVSAVRAAGGYRTDFPATEDYEFFWRLLQFGKGENLPAVWLKYEVAMGSAPSISFSKRRQQFASRLKLQWQFFNPLQPLSWWGILRTLLILAVPYKLLLKIKGVLWRV